MNHTLLIIEDDCDLQDALAFGLSACGYQVLKASDIKHAITILNDQAVDLIVSDVQLANSNGFELLEADVYRNHAMPLIYMTAHGCIQDAVSAIQKGAADYITKPFELQSLVEKIQGLLPIQASDNQCLNNDKIKHVYNLAKQVAPTDATVLLTGESGTGKEVLARYIHQSSNRADHPFIAINCAAIPDNMLEALLFGYEKGSFTGAHQTSAGKFEQANGGTILLDEISEMPLTLQAKLLRILQEKEVERLGGKKPIPLDVRVIANTNKDLMSAVTQKKFRSDLYFRLNVFPIHLPPLRERLEDLKPLTMQFIRKFQQVTEQSIEETVFPILKGYHWPGNIRELENVIQRACILAGQSKIASQHVCLGAAAGDISQQENEAPTQLSDQLSNTEHEHIMRILQQHQGNRSEVAKTLGISPRTLRYKIAKMKSLGYELP